MKIERLHNWQVTPREAVNIQEKLRPRIILNRKNKEIKFVAGADMAVDETRHAGFAGVIVYSFPELREVERSFAVAPIKFPYVPGLLAFREAPVLIEAFAQIKATPDVILFDGQGIAHPRGLGIASHMGLVLNKPTIGCAKSRLIGEHKEPGGNVGQWADLIYKDEVVGAVLRTRKNVKPIFVSPGHLIDLPTSIKIVLACLDHTRIPKPTREADHFVAKLKRSV